MVQETKWKRFEAQVVIARCDGGRWLQKSHGKAALAFMAGFRVACMLKALTRRGHHPQRARAAYSSLSKWNEEAFGEPKPVGRFSVTRGLWQVPWFLLKSAEIRCLTHLCLWNPLGNGLMQQKGETNGFLSMSCFSNKEYKSHVTGCCASWALLVYVQVEERMEKYANFGRAYCCQSSLITKTKAVWEIPQAPLCKTPRWEQPASGAIHTCKHAGIDAFFFLSVHKNLESSTGVWQHWRNTSSTPSIWGATRRWWAAKSVRRSQHLARLSAFKRGRGFQRDLRQLDAAGSLTFN